MHDEQISANIIENHKAEFDSKMSAVKRLSQRQLLSEGEIKSRLMEAQNAFFVGLRPYSEIIVDENQWLRMKADYEAWRKGSAFESDEGAEWLQLREAGTEINDAKKDFFSTRALACAGIAAFEPVPEDIKKPAVRNVLYCNSLVWMNFPSEEINELRKASKRKIIGNHRFVSDQGIVLHIDIQDVKKKNEFIGMGYIEGYMLPIPRKISINADYQNAETFLSFCYISDDDIQALRKNPEFKPYYDFIYQREQNVQDESYQLFTEQLSKNTIST